MLFIRKANRIFPRLKRVISQALVETALPLARAWAKKQERWILRVGQPLTHEQMIDARRIGILRADDVRVARVPMIPPRMHPALRYLAARFGMKFEGTIGMALGYGIFIREDIELSRALLAHELAHVRQYERLGHREFLRQYLHECLTLGYPLGSLEAEARDVAASICA